MGKNAIFFNKVSKTLKTYFFRIFIVLVCVGILVIKLVSDVVIQRYNANQVLDEMDFIASEQVMTINRAFDRNFIPLLFISDYLAKHGGFENNLNSDFLNAMIDGNDWTALRFADLNGNSINYKGEDRGNVSDMPFFYEIARNNKPQMLRMRWDSFISKDIYLFFAVPYFENGNLKGVLYAIRQLDNLEFLFRTSLSSEPLRIMIINSQMEVLATNAPAREYLGEKYVRGAKLPELINDPIDWDFLEKGMQERGSTRYQYEKENSQFTLFQSLGINDWELVVSGDKEALSNTYSVGQKKAGILILSFLFASWTLFVYLFLIMIINIYNRRLNMENIRFEQERNAILLDRLNCDFFDYNTATGELRIRDKVYTWDTLGELSGTIFASFDEKTFKEALAKVRDTGTSYMFDAGVKGDNIWHRIVLSPFKDDNGKVTYIFGSILDRTKEHNALLKSKEMTNVLNAFAQDFECLYVVDLTTDKFKTLNSSGEFGEIGISTNGDNFFDIRNYDYTHYIYHEDYDYICSMVNKEKIVEALKTARNYVFNYRVVHNTKPIYYQFRGMLNADDSNILFVAIRNIDSAIRREADMLQKERVYRNAIVSSCILYANINLSRNKLIEFCNAVNSATPQEVDLPLEKPYKYDQFLQWCVNSQILSEKSAFMNSCNAEYLIGAFNSGMPYIELQCRAKFFNGDERSIRVAFFINRNTGSGDIMALCIVYDITELSLKNKEVKELQEALKESRIKNSMSQMQPHFLYNALGSIREIILDDPQYASDLIYDFTTHLRACIKAMSSNDLIPFEQEITNIEAYVNIERMRFGDKLKVVYDIQKKDFKIVPLGIQPLVENSIRHGIYRRGKAGGTVTVRSYGDGKGNIVVQVQDDGVGFDFDKIKAEIASGKRDSTGMLNLIFRFEKMLNAKVDVQSTVGVGSTVTITFPAN